MAVSGVNPPPKPSVPIPQRNRNFITGKTWTYDGAPPAQVFKDAVYREANAAFQAAPESIQKLFAAIHNDVSGWVETPTINQKCKTVTDALSSLLLGPGNVPKGPKTEEEHAAYRLLSSAAKHEGIEELENETRKNGSSLGIGIIQPGTPGVDVQVVFLARILGPDGRDTLVNWLPVISVPYEHLDTLGKSNNMLDNAFDEFRVLGDEMYLKWVNELDPELATVRESFKARTGFDLIVHHDLQKYHTVEEIQTFTDRVVDVLNDVCKSADVINYRPNGRRMHVQLLDVSTVGGGNVGGCYIEKARVMLLSPHLLGSIAHECGHYVFDTRKKQIRDDFLQWANNVGLPLRVLQGAVHHKLSKEDAKYYMDEQEMFARTFEAWVRMKHGLPDTAMMPNDIPVITSTEHLGRGRYLLDPTYDMLKKAGGFEAILRKAMGALVKALRKLAWRLGRG